MIGLWSTVYGLDRAVTTSYLDQINQPCHNDLWTATSSAEWKVSSQKFGKPSRLQEAVDDLLAERVANSSEFSPLCTIAGLLVNVDDLNQNADLSSSLGTYIEQAICTWSAGYAFDGKESSPTTTLAFAMATYLRVSLAVDLGSTMKHFLDHDFHRMQLDLRKGNLRKAGYEALIGLRRWNSNISSPFCVTIVPCGETSSTFDLIPILMGCKALVLTEYSALLAETGLPEAGDAKFWGILCDLLGLAGLSGLRCSNISEVWKRLRKLVGGNPGKRGSGEHTSSESTCANLCHNKDL